MATSCSNCEATTKKYNESITDCERLITKLKDYRRESDQCQAWIIENNQKQIDLANSHEINFKKLIDDLEGLSRNQEGKNEASAFADSMQLMLESLINVYKTFKINDFETKYEPHLRELVFKMIPRAKHIAAVDVNNNPSTPTSTLNTNNTAKLSQVINHDLSEIRQKTIICKEKMYQQKQLLQSMLNTISTEYKLQDLQATNLQNPGISTAIFQSSALASDDHSISTSTSNSTSSLPPLRLSGQYQQFLQHQKLGETYMCPKCQVQIDSSKIALKKVESHIKKCDSSKLVCIFCLKLYEKSEQVLFENHVQKHLIKQTLERSPTTTVSTLNRADTNANHAVADQVPSVFLLNDSSDTSASNNSNFE